MKLYLSARLTGFSTVASSLLLLAVPVGAQQMMGGMGMGMYGGDAACQHRTIRQGSKHLAQLKSKLHLTSAQQPAWEAFLKSMMTLPEFSGGLYEPVAMAKLTTPERIEKMNALHDQNFSSMQAHMKQRGEAVMQFYAQLSAEQQKNFDAEFLAFHGRHMGR